MKASRLCPLVPFVLAACSSPPHQPLPTVPIVDLKRYSGHWYEIARLPNRFQHDQSRATANYTLEPGGKVKVRNTEYRPDGHQKSIEGQAVPVEGSHNARLRVQFSGLASLAISPAEGNYWIIALEPDYSAALVGTPDRDYLWLLARSPNFPPASRDRLIQRAKALHCPVEKLIVASWPTNP